MDSEDSDVEPEVGEEQLDEELVIDDVSGEADSHAQAVKIQEQAAEFLSFIKQECVTTQVTVDSILKGVDNLFHLYNNFLKAKIFELSEGDSVPKKDLEALFLYMNQQTIFEGVQSKYRLAQYRESKWNAVVPKKIVFAWKKVVIHGKVKQVPSKVAYYFDFLEHLEVLLQCDDVLDCIDNPKPPSQEFTSVLDGYVYQNHPVVQKYPNALGIVLYLDDVKAGDSLSSYVELGIRNYLWTLANIYPELRSSVRAINLHAIAKASVAKEVKNGPILKNFIDSVNRLSSEEGVTFTIKGKSRVFHGFLLFVIGDYPALANLGGFKESASFAWRFCRQCLVTQADKSSKYVESEVKLRSAALHQEHLQIMTGKETDRVEEEERGEVEEEEMESQNPSVKFGVNGRSPLLDVNYFDVTRCLPQDIMHLFLEGIVETECRFVLDHAISDKKLSLKLVNLFIVNFDYGKLQTNKPSPIEPQHLKNGLRQTSAQMLMLSIMLPFIVKGHCESARLQNLILLMKILSVCLSHHITLADVSCLKIMIKKYLMQFNNLYPKKFTPKHHFLIHLPAQVVLFGVLTEQWAMRFEAFHSSLKRMAKILHNAKNLPFSLIMHVSASQAFKIHCHQFNFLRYSAIKAKVNRNVALADVPQSQSIMECLKIVENCEAAELLSLKWYGPIFSKGDTVLITPPSADALPKFATVVALYTIQDKYILLVRMLRTISYCAHFNAYEVKCDLVAEIGVMDITEKINIQQLVTVHDGSADYVIMRQNNSPEF